MSIQKNYKDLSESNSKIIENLAAGKVYKEVAAILGMNKRTVIDRVQEMKRRHECGTIAQLVLKYQSQV